MSVAENRSIVNRYPLRGGPCDGEYVALTAYWNGREYVPPPHVRVHQSLPLPASPLAAVPAMEPDRALLYLREVFSDRHHSWYEYRFRPG